jgi:hypothetical protein
MTSICEAAERKRGREEERKRGREEERREGEKERRREGEKERIHSVFLNNTQFRLAKTLKRLQTGKQRLRIKLNIHKNVRC